MTFYGESKFVFYSLDGEWVATSNKCDTEDQLQNHLKLQYKCYKESTQPNGLGVWFS